MIELFAIHTAVLVGLVVAWLWTESYGGVFAGFAVPGYLAAIAMVAPSAAVAIGIEAVLTYALVRLSSDGLARLGLTARAFGRERFLLFVLWSVPVRLVVEGAGSGGLADLLGPWIPGGEHLGFFGVGLVLVPLTANAFWKLGLARGVAQLTGTTSVTMALLWAVVMPVLGLDLSSFLLTLENIATEFLTAPRVTILLLTTAVLATWTAERYGWNAGGLLVPSLLALLVFGPVKLLMTFVEIVLLLALYRVITGLPYIRRLPLVGPRRLILMYVMAWTLKVSLAWTGLQLELPVAAWDLYGFGYLLGSLVAVRCLDLRPPGRVLVPLGINVGVGATLGLGVAMLLGLVAPAALRLEGRGAEDVAPTLVADIIRSAGAVREDAMLRGDRGAIVSARTALDGGNTGVELPRSDGASCRAHRPEGAVGPRVWWCGGDGPVLLVPAARTDPHTVWMAARVLDEGQAAGLVLGGRDLVLAGRGGAALVARTAALAGPRPILLVRSASEGSSAVRPRGAAGMPVALPGVEGSVPLDLAAETGDLTGAWDALRDDDALLILSIPEQAASFPPTPTVHALPPVPGPLRPLASPSLAWMVRLGLMSDSEPAVRGLAWAAGQVGLRASRDGEGPTWLVETEVSGFGAWTLWPGPRSPWVVLAPAAPEESGTGEVARHLAVALKARAAWTATTGSRALRPRTGQVTDAPDPALDAAREALRGVGPPAPAAVVAVRRLSDTAIAPPPVALGPTEGSLLPPEGAASRTLAAAVASTWPDARPIGVGDPVGPPSLTAGHPLRYAHALSSDRAWTLWLRRDILGGVPDTPDHDAARRWYGLRGVPTLDRRTLIDHFEVDLDASLDDPERVEALGGHLAARSTASIEVLRGLGRPVRVQDGLRAGVALVTEDHVCLRVIGASGGDCWERR